MSDFLEHKKTFDPAAWVALIPEKWRLPVMLGGPALLLILLMPLLFRDDRAKPIDRNTVDGIANSVRSESRQRAAHEAALDQALARKVAADQQAAGPGAALPAAAAPTAPAAAAPSPVTAQATAGAAVAGPQAQAAQARPRLKGELAAADPGAGAAGGPGAGAAKAAPGRAASGQAPQLAPPPRLNLRAFDWKGPGAGAGREIVTSAGVSLPGGTGKFESSGAQSSAFVSGAGAYAHSAGLGSGGSGFGAGSSGGSGGGSLGSGSAGSSSAGQTPVNQSDPTGLSQMAKQCQQQNALYQPQVNQKQQQLSGYESFRSQNNCKDIGCGNCQVPSSCYDNSGNYTGNGGVFVNCSYYHDYVCPCAANRCNAQRTCGQIQQLQEKWKQGCPMMQNQDGSSQSSMDCSKV